MMQFRKDREASRGLIGKTPMAIACAALAASCAFLPACSAGPTESAESEPSVQEQAASGESSGEDAANEACARAAERYREALSTAADYFEAPGAEYSYALVNVTGQEIPELLIACAESTQSGVNTVRVFSYDSDIDRAFAIEGEIYEGAAGAGGYRAGLTASVAGDGLLRTEWSSGSGDGSVMRVNVESGAVTETLLHKFEKVGQGDATFEAVVSEGAEITWLPASDASALDTLAEGSWESTVTDPDFEPAVESGQGSVSKTEDKNDSKAESEKESSGDAVATAEAAGMTVVSGTVYVLDAQGVCDLQGISNPNPSSPDSALYTVMVFDAPTSIAGQHADGSGMGENSASVLLLDRGDGSAYAAYDGASCTVAFNPSDTAWPSDTSLPLGAPRAEGAQVIAG